MADKSRLSVLLPTFNSERTVRAALESVKWADEIVVVDSFSGDGTLSICGEYTDRILRHEYINSAAQKNWAIPQCRNDWILQIDSDEELEAGLREEIEAALAAAGPDIHCYRIPRKNHLYGRWVRSIAYPDYQTRLFRKATCRYEDKAVHAFIVTEGGYGRLKRHLLHHNFEDVEAYLQRFGRYSRCELEVLVNAGRRLRWFDLYLRPALIFFYIYVLRGGWREGVRGLLSARLTSWYIFLKYMKLWEHEWRQGKRR